MTEERAAELLERWQSHEDVDALDELLRIELALLKRHLRGLPDARLHPASRDDVAQEAVLRLLGAARPPRFPNPAALQGYLWRSAKNLLIDRLRRSKRVFLELDARASADLARDPATAGSVDRVEREDLCEALELALNLLAHDDQRVLRLVYFRGLSIEEAARELGVERSVANTRLVRARVRLAERVGAWRDFVLG